MTRGALAFMLVSWTFVLGLAGWSFWRVLRSKAVGRGTSSPERPTG